MTCFRASLHENTGISRRDEVLLPRTQLFGGVILDRFDVWFSRGDLLYHDDSSLCSLSTTHRLELFCLDLIESNQTPLVHQPWKVFWWKHTNVRTVQRRLLELAEYFEYESSSQSREKPVGVAIWRARAELIARALNSSDSLYSCLLYTSPSPRD